MKLMERMKQKRLGNKGFSLVELIIVIAIMAILIGIVGTQVVPYLRKAREERDMQILDSFATSAVSLYSFNSDWFADAEYAQDTEFQVNVDSGGAAGAKVSNWTGTDVVPAKVKKELAKLTGYEDTAAAVKAMSSADGKKIKMITVTYNFSTGEVTARAWATGTNLNNKEGQLLRDATAHIGSVPGDE